MLTITLQACMTLVATGAREEESYVTELRHLPEGWLAVAGLALIVACFWAVAWMYRHEGRIGASARVRTVAALLRCAVLAMLAIVLLEPIRVKILRRWMDSYTVVLVDDSSSMDLTDTYRAPSAARRVNRLLATRGAKEDSATSAGTDHVDADTETVVGVDTDPRSPIEPIRRTDVASTILAQGGRSFLGALAENNRVQLYDFSDEPQLRVTIRAARERAAQTAPPRDDTPAIDEAGSPGAEGTDAGSWGPARGPTTNIERAIRRSVEAVGSAPVAAVVVLSDGGFNQGASVEDTARYARDRRIPIHTIGIGDPSDPINVRVTELVAPPNAFQQDPFSLTARLTADGLDGRSLQIRLRESRGGRSGDDMGGRTVGTREVRVGPGGAIEPVVFQRRQERTGPYVYTVEVPVLEGEAVPDDNTKQTTVNVIDSRLRVLIVAGGPSWDYRFVSRLFQRDETFDLSCWLQSADLSAVRDGNTVIDHLPTTAEELFDYDVVVLMDPDENELDESWCRLIDTLVTEHGGGLLFTAARPHTPACLRDPSLKPLHDLLPVTLDPEADLVLNQIGHYQVTASPIEIPTTAYGHPVLKLADDPVSTKLAWQGMGIVYWHYPVLREKPVATVLMRHGNPRMRNPFGGHVLAAVQFVGAGRTGFLGFDATWRWRRLGVEPFDRFWVQLVRYLAEGKLLGGTRRGTVLTESHQYALGEAVSVSARLFDAQYKPLSAEQVTARYTVDRETTEFTLTAQHDRPGWLEGRFVPDRTGSYRISVKSTGADEGVEISRDLRVARPNIEMLRPQMDRAALMALSEGSHGGRYYEVDEAAQLPAAIPDLHEEISIRSRPTTLWDHWAVLTLLLALLSIEWGLRKFHRLL